MTDEWNPLDPPDGHQTKYYVPGSARSGSSPGKATRTRRPWCWSRRSVSVPRELAEARAEALKEDARAYKVSSAVYGATPRAKRTARVDRPE